ncbi:MAG TPA: glycosyltransferase family 2 protein [Terriglobia bacterium]|nr:glycosyltransferase family 2 protein [Terriglobia bacterium]
MAEATDRPGTTFVIVNWNRRALLEQCLRSLEQQTASCFDVVLVDNGSTDGSLDGLAQFARLSLQVIRNQENCGFAPAVNQGIRQARGRFVALVNNDVVLDPHWLESMSAAFQTDPRLGMCASKILFADPPHLIDKVGHVIYPDGQNYGRGHLEVDRGQYDRPEGALCPDGAAAIYRAEVFESAGLFDEDFFAYGDDADLGLRAQLCGWKCLYVPAAMAYHYRSSTLGEYAPAKIFLVERNRIWLALKLFPWRLLMLLPFYSAIRYLYSFWSLATRRGDVGRATRRGSALATLGAVLRAEYHAARRIPFMLRKRREIAHRQRISTQDFIQLLRRHRISARDLTR